MDIQIPKNAKIQTKTHEMDVLEALENETLESHNSVLQKAIAGLLCRLPEYNSHNVQPRLLVGGKIRVIEKWNELEVFSTLDTLSKTYVSTSHENWW